MLESIQTFVVLGLLFIMFIAIHKATTDFDWELLGFCGCVICLVSIVAIPVSRLSYTSEIVKMKGELARADHIRELGDDIERTAFLIKESEIYGRIAELQFWNKTILGGYIPDSIETLFNSEE